MGQQIPVVQIETPKKNKKNSTSIVTRSYTGLFRNVRLLFTGFLLAIFFFIPWINWNDRQSVLWDFPNGRFYIFNTTFWPQDFILLSALLIICAFGLFFLTVLAGRVWCGYSCPQSVWTWIFLRIEHLTQGERNQRIKLQNAPWSVNKAIRVFAKHFLWLLVGLISAVTFVGYFTPIRELSVNLMQFQATALSVFWVFFFTLGTYLAAGFLREKVCTHMCPYSRFQSVMFDDSTLLVSYDAKRGEPRGTRKKGQETETMGSCIDCTLCVQVCPTGIDIRDGLQLGCINCGACVDVCNEVMDKMNYPRDLISYTSERALAGGKTHFLRPRLVGYAITLLVMFIGLGWGLSERAPMRMDVIKDRTMFRENLDGYYENTYMIKVINKTQEPRSYQISLKDAPHFQLNKEHILSLQPGEIGHLPVTVTQTQALTESFVPVVFAVHDIAKPEYVLTTKNNFTAPVGQ
ncbi:cytochrome c oxidase accessory protein CcoG [Pseudomonas sp. F1_0610]|uniref:cytochrome c oxidase accessory protein CcoG n=1 Tax=Pseudomonas sp. F1_0610 TaxID=3114284 RepID=UPI0039C30079